jgi:hypothetical protein
MGFPHTHWICALLLDIRSPHTLHTLGMRTSSICAPTHTLDMRAPFGHTLSTHTSHFGHAYFFYMRSHTHTGYAHSFGTYALHILWACVLLLHALPHILWACVLLLYALPYSLKMGIYTHTQSKSFVPHLLSSNTCFSFTSYYGSHIL